MVIGVSIYEHEKVGKRRENQFHINEPQPMFVLSAFEPQPKTYSLLLFLFCRLFTSDHHTFAVYLRPDGMSLGVSVMTLLRAAYEVILLRPSRIW